MRRRDFITLVGGTAVWPLSARAKEPDRIRRIGMLVVFNDPDIKAFQDELEKQGWSESLNENECESCQ
jgi:putative ABC transport system substrate-binding protein